MGTNIGYQRRFWIFQQEDSGFGSGQEPSGYIKLEIKKEKVKISALVQNLKEDESKFSYKLYIMKYDGKQVIPVCLGLLSQQRNRAELQTELDSYNISGAGDGIQDFNAAAIIVEYKDRENTRLICPLSAYKDKKFTWRDDLAHAIFDKSTMSSDTSEKFDLASVFQNKLQSKYNQEMAVKSIFKPDKPDETGNVFEYNPIIEKAVYPEGVSFSIDSEENHVSDSTVINTNEETENAVKTVTSFNEQNTDEFMDKSNNKVYAEQTRGNESENQGCDINKLKESLGRYFKEYDPFGSRRRDYKWWKVSSPVYLNNILYQCNARTPLLFNPKVMMAHFKYRHLIIGVYSDRLRRRDCIVCGVPGAYSIDENPFGEVCRWVQLEGNKPKYGAFGYWLIYIDPKTGKIINLG